ncbi:glycoside hydrolase family 36 N-terminal domain-containing protein, partial [Streptococcus suis]
EDDVRFFSLQYSNPDFACYCTTDYFSPTFVLVQKDGSSLSHFLYQGHVIYAGRSALKGLTHLYQDEEGHADSLDNYLLDE